MKEAVTLKIRDSARPPVAAELDVQPLSTGQRAMRALTRVGVCWAVAIPCVLVPLLHFVLVPGLLLLGPILGALAFRATVEVTSRQVTCPKCTKETAIEPGTMGWPVGLRCAHCSTTFSASR